MKSFMLSALTGLAVCVAVLATDSQAQAQRRGGGASVGVYVGPSRNYGAGYNRGWYGNSYYGNSYYGNRSYGGYNYPSTSYYYPSTTYSYPATRSSYYAPPSADRYEYYTSNGWQICRDRYTNEYWYKSGGSWYRWY